MLSLLPHPPPVFFPAPFPFLKGFKEHLWETKIAPVVRGLHTEKASEMQVSK